MHVLKRTMIPAAIVLVALGGAGAAAQSGGDGAQLVVNPETGYSATLSGANEVPGPGDPDGAATARVTVNTATGAVCVSASTTAIDPITAMHVHEGAAGAAGPVRVDFAVTSGTSVAKCVTASTAQAQAIVANPTGFYLNIHTATYPDGAVRGQLAAASDDVGGLRMLGEPLRVYDSRVAASRLEADQSRTVDLTAGISGTPALPIGARAALITLTVTETTDAGFLTAYSNALTGLPGTSTVNWSASNQNVATTTTVLVDGAGRIKVTAGPRGTHFVLDLIGYYR